MTGAMIWVPSTLMGLGMVIWALPDRFLKMGVRLALMVLLAALVSQWAGVWHAPDALAAWFFRIIAVIAIIVIWYSDPYIEREARQHRWPPSRIKAYFALLLLFVASLVAVSLWTSFLFLWVDMEIVTLSSVVLVGIEADGRSLEAAWRFLIVTEAGGLLALIGTVVAVSASGHSLGVWSFHPALRYPLAVNARWALAGAYMILVGYGTKAGLAPFHTWLPDAHSEAPAPISSLLSALKLASAALLIYRSFQMVSSTVPAVFLHDGMIVLGLLSLLIAAGFVAFQTDLKRLWAYSSIEHIGLITLGMGFGGLALIGAMLHIWTHAVSKTLLFQNAGTVRILYHTSDSAHGAQDLLARTPWTGGLLALGAAGIVGLPPLAPFWSEWLIVAGGFVVPQYRIFTVIAVALLVAIFIGIARRMPSWLFRPGPADREEGLDRIDEPWSLLLPTVVLAVLVIGGGIGAPLVAPHLWQAVVREAFSHSF